MRWVERVRRTGSPFCLGVAISVLVASAANAQSVNFIGLGSLPGSSGSSAQAISADGNIVAVRSGMASRWTASTGLVALDPIPDIGRDSWPYDVSNNGVVAGWSMSRLGWRAVYWDPSGASNVIETPGTNHDDCAYGVSDDGNVVVGFLTMWGHERRAFRWTESTGLVNIGGPAESDPESTAYGVSGDGNVVFGDGMALRRAFRWTAGTGMVSMGRLPGAVSTANGDYPVASNFDGSVIVGNATNATGTNEAFRWTAGMGMVGLGFLDPADTSSGAKGVSEDGSVIVGWSGQMPFIWDADNGMRNLQTVLTDLGLDLTGWDLQRAVGVSADGRTIAGTGLHNGVTEAWVAVLPEPATLGLLALGGLAALRRRGRERRG